MVILITIPASLLIIIFGVFDPHGKHVYGISRVWCWLVLRVGGISVKVSGLDRLDPERQYIFMANHRSNLDIPVLIHSLPGFQIRWIAKRELLWIPLFGWAMWAAKHITVNRADRSAGVGILKKAQHRIAGGISVVVFPEGTRNPNERLLPFKRGGFLLAIKTQTAIVPVTISGSGKVLPKGDWRIKSGQVEVTVGEPIPVENCRPKNVRELSAHVHDRIAKNICPPSDGLKGSSTEAQPVFGHQRSAVKQA
jgi:1-acyl-sn-glycerol-3-phosphate acyltransferase